MDERELPDLGLATAREDLEQNLDEATLLPIFLGRAPARMRAAMAMIEDGVVTAEHFFHDHPFLTEIDQATGKQIPQNVSLLDDLIKAYKGGLPNLSPFVEGEYVTALQPDEQILKYRGVLDSLLLACRSDSAHPSIRQSANDPELVARGWSAFAIGLVALKLKGRPASVHAALLRGLDELEGLPPSETRAASASDFAHLVHILDIGMQCKAFKRIVQIMDHPSDTKLIYKVASSLEDLDRGNVPYCACYLVDNARTYNAFHGLPETIGKAVGTKGVMIEEWHDGGRLHIKLQKHLRAGSVPNG